MVRQKGTSRVTKPKGERAGAGDGPSVRPEERFPPLWKRKPGVFAVVVLGTLAMVIPLVAGLFQVLFN